MDRVSTLSLLIMDGIIPYLDIMITQIRIRLIGANIIITTTLPVITGALLVMTSLLTQSLKILRLKTA